MYLPIKHDLLIASAPPIKPKTNLSGFTLIELLVVMAIISMLMSIMLPSLNKVREIGKSTVCLSNLRQFALAWTMYAHDNEDRICASDTEWNGIQPWNGGYGPGSQSGFWVSDGPGMPYNDFCGTEFAIKNGAIWPYVEILDIYKCKSDKGGFVRSYAISHAMGSIYNLNGEVNFSTTTDITRPSQKTVFIDVEIYPYRFGGGNMEGVGPEGSIDPIDTYSKIWNSDISRLTYRHNKGCNMSFADGHSDRWKWKDRRTMLLMDSIGNNDLSTASINNPDLLPLFEAFRGARDRQW